MRILWVVNIMLPQVAERLGKSATNREGWLSGTLGRMCKHTTEYEISIAYPVNELGIPECTICDNIRCYPFFEDLSHPEFYDDDIESAVGKIIKTVNPHMVHIFGTEFPHAYAVAKMFNNPSRTVISMQGVCAKIAADYMALLPKSVYSKVTFRDFVRKDSIKQQQRKFYLRAVSEAAAIELVGNVIGRTFFDKEAILKINENARYFKVNETMRTSFYEGRWNYYNAKKHSIFLGQGDYPIKGMHFLLEACGNLISKYPDIEIKIAGNSIIETKSFKDRIRTPSYGKYLRELIARYNLGGNVKVLGNLTEDRMKEEYLSSAVFVCASYVENSPNTLAEAMLLGMPIVTSDAGGIKDMISSKEAYIFERGDVKELSNCLSKVFESEDNDLSVIEAKCQNAYERGAEEFNPEKNYLSLMEAYKSIAE